jgi:hypothetical protein
LGGDHERIALAAASRDDAFRGDAALDQRAADGGGALQRQPVAEASVPTQSVCPMTMSGTGCLAMSGSTLAKTRFESSVSALPPRRNTA